MSSHLVSTFRVSIANTHYYLTFVALHPYYKLTYIEHVWGGANEQDAERAAGNQDAKNWQDEARKILEKTVRNFFLNLSTCSL
jgi:hypothetical protein